jgi:hypothetical protein
MPKPLAYLDEVRAAVVTFLKDVDGEACVALERARLRLVPFLKKGNETHGEENEADRRFDVAPVRDSKGDTDEAILVSNVQRKDAASHFITLWHLGIYEKHRARLDPGKTRVYGDAFATSAEATGLCLPSGVTDRRRGGEYFAVAPDSPLSRALAQATLPKLSETFLGTKAGVARGSTMVMMRPTPAEKKRKMHRIFVSAPNPEKDVDGALEFWTLNEKWLEYGETSNAKGETKPIHRGTRVWVSAVAPEALKVAEPETTTEPSQQPAAVAS